MTGGILLVTGMVRSGTTVISRAIDAHPQIVCALDPCMGVLRAFNNALMRRSYGRDVPTEAPLSDFCSESEPAIDLYDAASMDLALEDSLADLRESIASFAESNSPAILPLVRNVDGQTYGELLARLLDVLRSAYGGDETRWVGFKQTWVEALAAPLMNTFPDARCVHVIRDPRAVIASWKESRHLTHDYPFLMMIRHWRKSVALASRWNRRFGHYLTMRYEDFAVDPEREMRRVAELCGLQYDPRMLDGAAYRAGDGGHWSSNTSYLDRGSDVTADFVDRWRTRLSDDEVALIEELCAAELAWLNIERETEDGQVERLLQPICLERRAGGEERWTQALEAQYALSPSNQAVELARWFMLRHGQEYLEKIPSQKLDSIILDQALVRQSTSSP